MPETTRGLPPAQIAPFVVERIGLTQARRLCLTGAQFRGAEALRLGIVHEDLADDAELQDKLSATLKQIMQCAPQANALTTQILLDVGTREMEDRKSGVTGKSVSVRVGLGGSLIINKK